MESIDRAFKTVLDIRWNVLGEGREGRLTFGNSNNDDIGEKYSALFGIQRVSLITGLSFIFDLSPTLSFSLTCFM